MDFSKKLQILRKQAGLTQDELALKIGVSRQAISKWESGGAYPDLSNIQTLCAFFSVTADTFVHPKYETPVAAADAFEFDESELGNNIKRIRSARGITQEVFAEQMKVSRQSVSKWENGTVIPKTEIIILMLDVLEAELSELLPPIVKEKETPSQDAEVSLERVGDKPTKPNKKLFISVSLVILILLAVSAAIVSGILFLPFAEQNYVEKSFKEMFFDTYAPAELIGKIENGGAEISLGSGENTLSVKLYASENEVAVSGLCESGDVYIFPRKNTSQALQNSVFSPSSGTQFALSREEYDSLASLLRGLEKESDEAISKSIESIVAECGKISPPNEKFAFAEGRFALKKTVTYSLDKQKIMALLDFIAAEAEKNGSFDGMYGFLLGYGNVTSAVKNIRYEILEAETAEMVFSYALLDGKIDGLNYSFDIVGKNKEVTRRAFDLNFIYGDLPTAEMTVTHSEPIDEFYISTVSKYKYSKQIFANGIRISLTSEESGEIGEDGNSEKIKVSESRVIEYNSETKGFQVFYKMPEMESETKIYGVWELDPEAGKFNFAVNYVEVDGEAVSRENTLVISLAAFEKTETPKGKSFFALSAEEMREFYKKLPAKDFEKLLESVTGIEPEFTYSTDGMLVPLGAELEAMEYEELFIEYYKSKSDEVKRFDTNRVYIYSEKYGVYVLLMRNGATVTGVKYAYKLNENITSNYHRAVVQNGVLKVHDFAHTKTTEPDCDNWGAEIYECSYCDKSYSVETQPGGCTETVYLKEATWDNGETYRARIQACTVCGRISTIKLDTGDEYDLVMTAWLERKPDGTYIFCDYINSHDSDYIFCIPESLLEGIEISEMRIDTRRSAWCMRIPEGIRTINKNSFNFNGIMQTLILPSTITKIEEGAFADAPVLHTIYYCGTEEDWKNVDIGSYAEKWAHVNVIFAPEGVSPETAAGSYHVEKTEE